MRNEYLDWTITWNATHLHRVRAEDLRHYNTARPHRGIGLDVPAPAAAATVTALPTASSVARVDVLGGLIHDYHRAA